MKWHGKSKHTLEATSERTEPALASWTVMKHLSLIGMYLLFSCRQLLHSMQQKKADYEAVMDKLQREVCIIHTTSKQLLYLHLCCIFKGLCTNGSDGTAACRS